MAEMVHADIPRAGAHLGALAGRHTCGRPAESRLNSPRRREAGLANALVVQKIQRGATVIDPARSLG